MHRAIHSTPVKRHTSLVAAVVWCGSLILVIGRVLSTIQYRYVNDKMKLIWIESIYLAKFECFRYPVEGRVSPILECRVFQSNLQIMMWLHIPRTILN